MVWDIQDKKEKSKTKNLFENIVYPWQKIEMTGRTKSEEKFRVLNFPFEQK